MKKIVLSLATVICVLGIIACKGREPQPKKSPLELLVEDYIQRAWPKLLEEPLPEGDTLWISANLCDPMNGLPSYSRRCDSVSHPDQLIVLNGSINNIWFPDVSRHLPPPPPPPPPSDDDDCWFDKDIALLSSRLKGWEDYLDSQESSIDFFEQKLLGSIRFKDTSAVFSNPIKRMEALSKRTSAIVAYFEEKKIINPYLLGYVQLGSVKVIVLDESGDDRYAKTWFRDLEFQDLWPYYERQNRDDLWCGWGCHYIYGIDTLGDYVFDGNYLVE